MEQRYQLVYKKTKTYRVDYTYDNRQRSQVDLWLALPAPSMTQRSIRILSQTTPRETALLPTENPLAYYEVGTGQRVVLSFSFDAYETRLVPAKTAEDQTDGETAGAAVLTDEKRQFYLRSTPLVPVNEDIRDEALRIVGDAREPLEQARRLFDHIVAHYRYHWPPTERGALAMRCHKKGDCGEFSFLFAAYCRALGIPCRTVIGAWAAGKFQAHAWNEFFVDGVGWIPVDASVAAAMKNPLKQLAFVTRYGTRSSGRRYFGSLEGKRVIFSFDSSLPLIPAYPDDTQPPVPAGYQSFMVGGEMLAWGYRSQQGTAPYLQPAYVRFAGKPEPASVADYMGTWQVSETAFGAAASLWIKRMSFALFFLCLFSYHGLSLFHMRLEWLNTLSTAFFTLLLLTLILRREAYWVTYLFAVLMALSLFASLQLF
ncbi:transglutaminase-like domain-containing protein [Brevibacillus thermoruber]|uniref:transglutaminase-like domain-containing protein n=1 Tax=Brevibacillus thermoruber TaxID=33942 RepID=UPI0040434837